MPFFLTIDVLTLQERASRALKSLKSFKKEVNQEHRYNFGAYVTTTGRKGKCPLFERQPAVKRSKQASWTHNFVCLANSNQTKPPTAGWEHELLLKAGLGEKKISFSNIDSSPEEYRDKLCSVFPKLMEAGGFEFMRCCSNSRMLEPISSTAMQSPRATNDRVGRSKVYIRPMQKDLCTKPVNGDSSTKPTLRSNLFALHIFNFLLPSVFLFYNGKVDYSIQIIMSI